MWSIFDEQMKDYKAQYASPSGKPLKKWAEVETTLKDLNPTRLHYVQLPPNVICIDFDFKDEEGNKDFMKNLQEASKWPPTYSEVSKSGGGIHLIYIYPGNVEELSRVYADCIEVKVQTGNSSLRRMLTMCNNLPIATISSGLPMKGVKHVIDKNVVLSEKGLRTFIKKNLNKEYHPGTKPSIDFIYKGLEDAYRAGQHYDVSDLKNAVIAFGIQSSNHPEYCIKQIKKMHFKSDDASPGVTDDSIPIIFLDCEVFPNLLLVNWKLQGEGNPVVRMINPKPKEIEELLKYRIIGFNNRRYDNHILYAAMLGWSNERIYQLSQDIVTHSKGEQMKYMFGEAYNLSYTDVYDFSAKKQSLKKWEIELGIHHQELGLPWDQPVPEERWTEVAEYCDNDVIATEAVFNHLKGDFTARQILADLAGGTVNDTTNKLTQKIVFGNEKHPKLVYTDLSETFPGYEYIYAESDKKYHNMYRGTDVGKGGYVYSQPGMYWDVALLDVASMHPHSIFAMNCFGKYTQNYRDILEARIAIKHKDYDKARTMLNGRLEPYLHDENIAKDLSKALKLSANSVYGMTSASYDNPFRDIRNKNNIVALRGALFMRTLQDEVASRGFTVAHIKTDSIKIPNATPEIIKFVMDFGKQYGYNFEHEATYDRMCLIDKAQYIAKFATEARCNELYGYAPGENKDDGGEWTATGEQFAVPVVFKELFSHEALTFDDYCQTFEVKKGALYLDQNESLGEDEHDYQFIGRIGQFIAVRPGVGGGCLYCKRDDKYDSASGAKGYRWIDAELLRYSDDWGDKLDHQYYNRLVDESVDAMSRYGDFEHFTSDDDSTPPWFGPDDADDCPFDVR